jgi:hypothetical protein
VDSNPLFALTNMPRSPESFVEWIGVDSYGHRSYDPSTPKHHIYNWKSVPHKVEDHWIDDYTARQSIPESDLSISELLGTTERIGTRIALYEAIIGRVMHVWEIGNAIRVLETASDRANIPAYLLSAGVDMVQVAVGRMLFGSKVKDAPAGSKGSEFSWLALDMHAHHDAPRR